MTTAPNYPFVFLQRLIAAFTVAFLFATSGLWIQSPTEINPQIPWVSWGCTVPFLFDQILLGLLGCSCAGLLLLPGKVQRFNARRVSQMGYFLWLSGLILLDQHRLQPWALQYLMLSLIILIGPRRVVVKFAGWLAISIYLYSAISKFDTAFLQIHGQLLLDGLLKSTAIDASFWSDDFRMRLAFLFPLGELIVATLLLTNRFRRWGVMLSWLMHLLILLSVGPLGLGHEEGVLLWNLFFIMQNYILFWRRGFDAPPETENKSPQRKFQLGYALITCFLTYPLLTNFGFVDHWPAWAVYSSRPNKVTILVDEDVIKKLPNELRTYLGQQAPLSKEVPFSLDAWSFQQRNCPVYPQQRYRLALAKCLLEKQIDSDQLRIKIEGTPDRWTGERSEFWLKDWSAVDEVLSQSWVNTKGRFY